MRLERGLLVLLILIVGFAVFLGLRSIGFSVLLNTTSNVSVNAINLPVINFINSSIFVCEGTSLFYEFNASDGDGDSLSGRISPQNPFFVFWLSQQAPNTHNFAIVSGTLGKSNLNGVNSGSKLYLETVYVNDNYNSTCCEDSENTNITVIEINNVPAVEDIGVKTIYTQGENSTLYEAWSVNDTEYNAGYGTLNFNVSIINSSGVSVNLFSINSSGVINFTANSSTTIGVYNVTLCVNDTRLTNAHADIYVHCGQNGTSNSVCDSFSLTVTNDNRAPSITNYNPINLTPTYPGTTTIGFNITTNDADGTIPDAYWYVDGVFNEYDTGSSIDTFSYSFGCGISGNHTVKVDITDGLLNASLQWNITVTNVACSSSSGTGGGGGGGGATINFESLQISPEFITTTVFQRQGKSFDVKINNTGTLDLEVSLEIVNLTNMAILNEDVFSLNVGEKKDIKLYLYSLSETPPGVYFGKIIFKAGQIRKEIKIVLEIKDREPLFDIKVKVPVEYKVVKAGDDVKVIVDMLNVGFYGQPVDVDLYLSIVNLEKILVYELSREVIAVETNLSIERTLHVPFDTTQGTYLVFGEAVYKNITATTFDTFRVQEKKFVKPSYLLLIIILILLLLFIFFLLYKRRKKKEREKYG